MRVKREAAKASDILGSLQNVRTSDILGSLKAEQNKIWPAAELMAQRRANTNNERIANTWSALAAPCAHPSCHMSSLVATIELKRLADQPVSAQIGTGGHICLWGYAKNISQSPKLRRDSAGLARKQPIHSTNMRTTATKMTPDA